ncbi:MAG: MOSC domain-containing protein [bacterium]|nr:MOSC domain-containing protein [bacterium]
MSTGTIVALSISETKGTPKLNVPTVVMLPEWGIEGDAHAGNWHRQVSLLPMESVAKMQQLGATVTAGSFAENITTLGIDLSQLQIGDLVSIENVRLEITQIGKECHARCNIYYQVGDCVMPREGIFARVLTGGTVSVGSPIKVDHSKS